MKSFSIERKADHNSSRLGGVSSGTTCGFSLVGSGGTLSVDVLGVERLSVELLGKLLVEEFVDAKVVKFISTLCGLCLIFCIVKDVREGLGGLDPGLTGLIVSTLG